MNLTRISLKNPYIVVAATVAIVVLGLIGFFQTPADLFPDTSPPQVLIVTIEPGASASDISDKITEVIEKELYTISDIKRVRATSRDEVSSVVAEFHYTKNINEGVTDVVNALERIKAQLPRDILAPQIYKITDATHSTMTLALSPGPHSPKSLSDIRLLAENDIKDQLLRLADVGDIDIFGGYLPEVKILADRDKMKGYNITLPEIIAAVSQRNITIPGGYLYTRDKEYLLKANTEFKDLTEIGLIPIKKSGEGYVLLQDVARIRQGVKEKRSLYHGNGQPAIAINILRPENGHTIDTIRAFKKFLPTLKKEYPDISFEITDDQQPIIDINLSGMRTSILESIILTVIIIFIFLADTRTATIISVSIPMSFLVTFMVLKFSPYTLNMVTLSGLIIATGMVVDASIVVLENIYRHLQEDPTLSSFSAALSATQEVAVANTAGALTLVIILLPVMFTGGYVQQVLRQLSIVISVTILASLLISLTLIPLMAGHMLKDRNRKKNRLERIFGKFDIFVRATAGFYVSILKVALRFKIITLLVVLAVFIFTARVVFPLLGGELMPRMDTGIVKMTLDMPSSYNIDQVENILGQAEAFIKKTPGYVSLSSVVGSEPGVISFGSGGATVQQAYITVNLLTRDKRKTTIWQIEEDWRKKLRQVDGIRSFTVTEFGATPLSTTRAPFDFIIQGKDPRVLNTLADRVITNLKGTRGLVDLRRSWYIDKPELEIIPDATLCRYYGVNSTVVANYIKFAARGGFSSWMSLEGFLDIPIRVEYQEKDLDLLSQIGSIYLPTIYGQVPLRSLVKVKDNHIQPFITREDLKNTIDITGINQVYTIAQAAQDAGARLKSKKMILPRGYETRMSGTPEDMNESRARLKTALIFGFVLLYLFILPTYKSFSTPVVLMSAIPLGAVGALWGLLILDKPMCMPALMGMILLAGVILKNAILLLDFILAARARGISRDEAIVQSVRVRTRPILMTAFSTILGLLPLVLELAVGLERLSPLGIVAAFGLFLGTFLTMVVIPVIYALLDDLKGKFKFSRKAAGILILFLSLFAGFLGTARAETALEPDQPFTLRRVIEYSLTHSPDLKIAEAAVDKSAGNERSSRSALLPHLNAVGDYTYTGEKYAIVPMLNGIDQRFDDSVLRGRLEANWLVTDFGKSYDTFTAARSARQAAEFSGEREKAVIIFRTSQLYFAVTSLGDLIEARQASYRSLEELLKRMKLFVERGKLAEIDLLKVKVRISQINDELEKLNARQTELRGNLEEIIGYQNPGDIQLAPAPVSFQEITDTGEVYQQALASRNDLAAARLSSQAGEELVVANERSYYPEIRLFGGWGAFAGTGGESKFAGDDRWMDDYRAGVLIQLPLFDSWLRSGKIQSARADYDKSRAEEEKTILAINSDIKKARADIKSARERIKLARVSGTEAQEALRLEKLKYEKGKGVINDVLDAEAALSQADYLSARAAADYNIGIFQLELARGKLLENYKELLPERE